jgi:hypothetical protein
VAISINGQWTKAWTDQYTTFPLPPSNSSVTVAVSSIAGDWLFAAIAWRQLPGQSVLSCAVDDDAHNWWDPVGLPSGTSPGAGTVRVALWRAPAALAAQYVTIAPAGPVAAVAAVIIDVGGLSQYVTDTVIKVAYANAATSLSTLTEPAPAASALFFAVGAVDLDSATVSFAGSGWTALDTVSATNSSDTSQDLQLHPYYQTSSGSVAGTYSSSATADLGGMLGGVLVSVAAPSQPISSWPVTTLEVGPNNGFGSPADTINWQPTGHRFLGFSMSQGKQYELDQLQAGTGTVLLDDPDGYLIPSIVAPSSFQLQFTGNGSAATPNATALPSAALSVTGGLSYAFAAWGYQSASWSSGMTLNIDWWTAAGGSHISYSAGSAVNATAATLLTVTATAPATATVAYVFVEAVGTPPASTIFYAAAAPGGNLIPPSSVSWAAGNSATVTTLAAWNNFAGLSSGDACRLRMSWPGGTWQVSWHGNGSTATPGVISTATGTSGQPVQGSSTYTVGAWVGCAVAWSAGAHIGVNWYTSGGSFISSSTGSASAALAANDVPLLVSATLTSPSNAAFATPYIQAVGTPASTVVFSAAMAPPTTGNLLGPPSITWATSNSSTIVSSTTWAVQRAGPPNPSPQQVVFSGYVERLPPSWDGNTYRGYTDATITDCWADMPSLAQPILAQEILNDSPYAYWPCTDATDATYASNFAPGNQNPLSVVASKYGYTNYTQSFGQNSSGILGAAGTYLLTSSVRSQATSGMWGQTFPSSGASWLPSTGWNLACTDASFPSLANGITWEFWFEAVTPSAGLTDLTWATYIACLSLSFTQTIYVSINPTSGQIFLSPGWDLVGGVGIGYFGADYWNIAAVQQIVLTMNTTGWSSFINGGGTNTGTWPAGGPASNFYYASLGGLNGLPNNYGSGISGYAGQLAIFPTILTNKRIATHYAAGNVGMAGDNATGRIERLCEAGGFGGRRNVVGESYAESTFVVSCQDISGQPATTSINNIIACTIPALGFVATSGAFTYFPRFYMYANVASLYTLGEYEWLGEIPYAEVTFDNDPSLVVNSIQLTQLDNQDVITPDVTAVETASIAQYGQQSDWTTGYLQGDLYEPLTFGPGLSDLANWIANEFATAPTRVSSVTVDAAAYPSAWPFWMQVNPGDMVTVNRRPPTQTTTLSVTARVLSVQRQLDWAQGVATVTCMLVYAPEQFLLTCDSTTLGLLNGLNILGW